MGNVFFDGLGQSVAHRIMGIGKTVDGLMKSVLMRNAGDSAELFINQHAIVKEQKDTAEKNLQLLICLSMHRSTLKKLIKL